MSYIKVEGHNNLVRDIRSNAIVNSNKSEFKMYMKRQKERNAEADKMRNVCKEINTLKAELKEIKELILKGCNK
tara:strand:+ start:339 stop:560 length:222 start_codon:yes stop_codon:yes gene_type:complete